MSDNVASPDEGSDEGRQENHAQQCVGEPGKPVHSSIHTHYKHGLRKEKNGRTKIIVLF